MTTPYTLTLHEADHPDQPITFTLDGDTFQMDIGALFGPETPALDTPPKEPWEERLELVTQKFIQPFSSPMHVRDVTFLAQGDAITLQIWKRLGGLRLAPILITIDDIDDPVATADFAQRVEEQAHFASRPGKYTGPLDYWGSWILMGLGVASAFISLGYWLSRRFGASNES